MAHYVLAFPEIEDSHRAWVEDYRRKHDPDGHALAPPHFTLVFGLEGFDDRRVCEEVREQMQGFGPIDFALKAASLHHDPLTDSYTIFLVPETGLAQFVALHNQLYAAGFSTQRRFDLDFLPHVTVGRFERPADGQRKVDEVNEDGLLIAGRVRALDVVAHENGELRRVETIELG